MNIGVDIDGVLTNLEEYIATYGAEYAENNGWGFDYKMNPNSVYGFLKKEHSHCFWDLNWFNYAKNVEARLGACEIINKLRANGHKIILITARTYDSQLVKYGEEKQKQMEQEIIEWLKKNNIVYDKIIFSDLNKAENIVANKIDIMIEDSVSNIEQLKPYTKIICFDAKYNRHYKEPVVKRAKSWNEIYKIVPNL